MIHLEEYSCKQPDEVLDNSLSTKTLLEDTLQYQMLPHHFGTIMGK